MGETPAMPANNILYAQSGGVTPVINATAAAVIQAARAHPDRFGGVFAAADGIIGALEERLIDTSSLTDDDLHRLPRPRAVHSARAVTSSRAWIRTGASTSA